MLSHPNPLVPLPATDPARLPLASLACATALLLGVALAGASAPSGTNDNAPPDAVTAVPKATAKADLPAESPEKAQGAAERHLREGLELVEVSGSFRTSAGRVVFTSADGRQSLVGLENLNLERVTRALADHPDQVEWIVTGSVTEFRGSNFLLLRRVVLKNRNTERKDDHLAQ